MMFWFKNNRSAKFLKNEFTLKENAESYKNHEKTNKKTYCVYCSFLTNVGSCFCDYFQILLPLPKVQELQMTTAPDENIQCLSVDGNFDDCQDIVKALFVSDAKQEFNLTAVNSINWARILAQIVYYWYSSLAISK